MLGRKVLLVDDEPDVLDTLDTILTDAGYEVATAHSGQEALARIEAFPAEIVLSDYMMPGMSGVELLHAIKQRLPHSIPILITGRGDMKISIESINQGEIFRFLLKPWNNQELKLTLKTALQYHDLIIENERLTTTVKRQSNLLDEIEKKYPGITEMQIEEDGTILLEDEDFSDALRTLHVEEEADFSKAK